MMPMIHPWTDWQEDVLDSEKGWKWKDNTPEEIKKQYEEWEKYYKKMTKIKF